MLVVLVVILFLQTWRASIIPLLAVPVSIVGTFAVMYLLGFSINALSLFGLVLAIGIVVDDAIVVVENVERNIEEGLSPREATYRAMQEVSGPIIAIALVLVAVFVPLAFITGLTGQFYKQFALDHRDLDGDLGDQLADAVAGDGRPAVAVARSAQGRADAGDGQGTRLVLPRLQQGLQERRHCLWHDRARSDLAQDDHARHLLRRGDRDLRPVQGGAGRFRSRSGQAVPCRLCAAARRAPPSTAPRK